jgi:hypothetical protein
MGKSPEIFELLFYPLWQNISPRLLIHTLKYFRKRRWIRCAVHWNTWLNSVVETVDSKLSSAADTAKSVKIKLSNMVLWFSNVLTSSDHDDLLVSLTPLGHDSMVNLTLLSQCWHRWVNFPNFKRLPFFRRHNSTKSNPRWTTFIAKGLEAQA